MTESKEYNVRQTNGQSDKQVKIQADTGTEGKTQIWITK